jgi:hypothetical protein
MKMMCLWASYKKKIFKNFFMASLMSLKKGVGSGVGSGSGFISQRYGSGDPDPHHYVTDPQYWYIQKEVERNGIVACLN